jgi:hypothetical protein
MCHEGVTATFVWQHWAVTFPGTRAAEVTCSTVRSAPNPLSATFYHSLRYNSVRARIAETGEPTAVGGEVQSTAASLYRSVETASRHATRRAG